MLGNDDTVDVGGSCVQVYIESYNSCVVFAVDVIVQKQ